MEAENYQLPSHLTAVPATAKIDCVGKGKSIGNWGRPTTGEGPQLRGAGVTFCSYRFGFVLPLKCKARFGMSLSSA